MRGKKISVRIPRDTVNQTSDVSEREVPTASLLPEAQRGGIPGSPGARRRDKDDGCDMGERRGSCPEVKRGA
jgi:hypothetical protein